MANTVEKGGTCIEDFDAILENAPIVRKYKALSPSITHISNQGPSQPQTLQKVRTFNQSEPFESRALTVKTRVVWFHVHRLDLSILELKNISLTSWTSENCRTIKR